MEVLHSASWTWRCLMEKAATLKILCCFSRNMWYEGQRIIR